MMRSVLHHSYYIWVLNFDSHIGPIGAIQHSIRKSGELNDIVQENV